MRGGAYTEDPVTGALKRVEATPAELPAENQAPAEKSGRKTKPGKPDEAGRATEEA